MLRQLVLFEGRSYIKHATRFFAFFALQTTSLEEAFFITCKTDCNEYKGPDPAHKVCTVDQ